MHAAESGHFGKLLTERWSPEAALVRGDRPVGDRDLLVRGMECDLEAGVRQHLAHAVAGRSLVVWEMDISNPDDDPEHCPPAVAWLMSLDGAGRVHRLRLVHPGRCPSPGTACVTGATSFISNFALPPASCPCHRHPQDRQNREIS